MIRFALPLLVLLAGCAARSAAVPATEESALRYARADCASLTSRAAALDERIAAVSREQDAIADDDAIAATAGFLMSPAFWLVSVYRDNPAAELAALKGDRDAVALVARESRCPPAR